MSDALTIGRPWDNYIPYHSVHVPDANPSGSADVRSRRHRPLAVVVRGLEEDDLVPGDVLQGHPYARDVRDVVGAVAGGREVGSAAATPRLCGERGPEPWGQKSAVDVWKGNNVLSVGRTYVVILADYPSLKEALGRSTTTDRPDTVFDFIPDGVGFSSVNGEEWVEQRRYCMRAMRNVGLGRDTWKALLQTEVSNFVDLISKKNGRPFDITLPLTTSVSRNISALVFGRRLALDDKTAALFADAVYASSQFAPQIGVRSAFPRFMDALARVGLMEKKANLDKLVEFNRFVRNQVAERRQQNMEGNQDDFIEGYLLKIKENQESNLGNTFNETNLHGNIQALFIGASDTTRTSLCWLLVAMATHPEAQARVQEEVDREGGAVTWAGRGRFPVTMATIMEGQRWRTVAPFNTGRVAMEDMKLGGYDIPKGTTLIANNWGVHHDTNYWTDPEEFRPERFLSENGTQVNLKPESYVPFSYGKRNCPGETVAMMEILFYFVAILSKFSVLPPEGRKVNLQGTLGLTYQTVPQELRFVPRT